MEASDDQSFADAVRLSAAEMNGESLAPSRAVREAPPEPFDPAEPFSPPIALPPPARGLEPSPPHERSGVMFEVSGMLLPEGFEPTPLKPRPPAGAFLEGAPGTFPIVPELPVVVRATFGTSTLLGRLRSMEVTIGPEFEGAPAARGAVDCGCDGTNRGAVGDVNVGIVRVPFAVVGAKRGAVNAGDVRGVVGAVKFRGVIVLERGAVVTVRGADGDGEEKLRVEGFATLRGAEGAKRGTLGELCDGRTFGVDGIRLGAGAARGADIGARGAADGARGVAIGARGAADGARGAAIGARGAAAGARGADIGARFPPPPPIGAPRLPPPPPIGAPRPPPPPLPPPRCASTDPASASAMTIDTTAGNTDALRRVRAGLATRASSE